MIHYNFAENFSYIEKPFSAILRRV